MWTSSHHEHATAAQEAAPGRANVTLQAWLLFGCNAGVIMIARDDGWHEEGAVLKATGEFRISGGHEETYTDRNPGRLTRAGGSQEFSGGIDGVGRIEWLMCYRGDRTAEFVGLQEIEGAVDGRRGSFVLTSVGSHDGVHSTGTWTVVSGTGKGDLAGIVGNGRWKAGPGPRATFELTYEVG